MAHFLRLRALLRPGALLFLLTLLLSASPNTIEAATPQPTRQPRIMVALVLGQSNAANFGETRHTSGPGVYSLSGRWLYYARDPLRGANGEGGSVWTRLGDRLIASGLYDAVIFVPAAIGGTEIARWTPDGDLHPLILKAIEDAHNRGLKITHVFWHQGESDAYFHTSAADYRARFLAMLASIRLHGVDAPVFVAVATHCGKYPIDRVIEQAQRQLVNPDQGIFAGPDTDALGDQYRVEGCHFNTEGLDQHAALWQQQIKAQIELAKQARKIS